MICSFFCVHVLVPNAIAAACRPCPLLSGVEGDGARLGLGGTLEGGRRGCESDDGGLQGLKGGKGGEAAAVCGMFVASSRDKFAQEIATRGALIAEYACGLHRGFFSCF